MSEQEKPTAAKERRAREQQALISRAVADEGERCGATKWVGSRTMVCVRPPHNTRRIAHKHNFV